MDYVAGLLFSGDREHVALVEKIKPEWQRGRLNGIGGKIEAEDASPLGAMIREFEEETGLRVPQWDLFCELRNRENLTYFFRSFAAGSIAHVSGREAERISAYPVPEVDGLNIMPNLRWLIPMALDAAAKASVDYAP